MRGDWPSIDHGILSPSGRVSKRARRAALKREEARLFPPGFWSAPTPPITLLDRIACLLRAIANLRDLADRGMSPRKHRREADRLESEIARLRHTEGAA